MPQSEASLEKQTTIHTIKLSPFDQLLRLYVHKLFCFPFPEPQRQPEAELRIQQALSATILKWPFITGHVCPAEDSTQKNAVQLCYETPAPGSVPDHVFKVKNLTQNEFEWTYEELATAGMPPRAMKMDLLSTVQEWPKPAGVYPALAVQANFIPGGLIMCFAFHHAVADGGSFIQFIKAFAEATKSSPNPDTALLSNVPFRIAYIDAPHDDVRALRSFPEYNAEHILNRPEPKPRTGMSFAQPVLGLIARLTRRAWLHDLAFPRCKPRQITNRILTFSAATVQHLERFINAILKDYPEAPKWASPIACLSSLIWVAVVRARQSRLDPTHKTKIGIAVDARTALEKPNYFGNAVVHTNAIASISELLADEDADPDTKRKLTMDVLACAAHHMRRATEGVNKKYVNDRLTTFSALADPTEVPSIYGKAMDTHTTGIDFSSWISQGADIEFGIPGIGSSTVAFWRKAWSPNEGAYNILPRKGGSKGTANWEVSIGLSVEDMEKVCEQLEEGAWLERVVE